MRPGKTGVYFRKSTKEVLRVASEGEVPAGDDWIHVSEETDLGLLQAREVLRARALVDDARDVYWYGMWGDGALDESTNQFVQKFKRTSEEVRREAGTRDRGLWSRLTGVPRPLGRGRPGTHRAT